MVGERLPFGRRFPSHFRDLSLVSVVNFSGRSLSLLLEISNVRMLVNSYTWDGISMRSCSLNDSTPVFEAVSIFWRTTFLPVLLLGFEPPLPMVVFVSNVPSVPRREQRLFSTVSVHVRRRED